MIPRGMTGGWVYGGHGKRDMGNASKGNRHDAGGLSTHTQPSQSIASSERRTTQNSKEKVIK